MNRQANAGSPWHSCASDTCFSTRFCSLIRFPSMLTAFLFRLRLPFSFPLSRLLACRPRAVPAALCDAAGPRQAAARGWPHRHPHCVAHEAGLAALWPAPRRYLWRRPPPRCPLARVRPHAEGCCARSQGLLHHRPQKVSTTTAPRSLLRETWGKGLGTGVARRNKARVGKRSEKVTPDVAGQAKPRTGVQSAVCGVNELSSTNCPMSTIIECHPAN